MKKKKLISVLALALIMVSCFTLGANAATGMQEITAYLNANITVKLEGEAQTFLDANGNRVYSITYNGSTYLPVRAVAGLVGLAVDWDQATQTVQLGKQPGGVDLIDTYKSYQITKGGNQYQTGDKDAMEISGVECSRWLEFFATWGGPERADMKYDISFNLGGKHDTLTFSYYADHDATLQILGDNETVLFEKAVAGGQVAQTATIPLFETSQLTIRLTEVGADRTRAYVFDAYLDAEG